MRDRGRIVAAAVVVLLVVALGSAAYRTVHSHVFVTFEGHRVDCGTVRHAANTTVMVPSPRPEDLCKPAARARLGWAWTEAIAAAAVGGVALRMRRRHDRIGVLSASQLRPLST